MICPRELVYWNTYQLMPFKKILGWKYMYEKLHSIFSQLKLLIFEQNFNPDYMLTLFHLSINIYNSHTFEEQMHKISEIHEELLTNYRMNIIQILLFLRSIPWFSYLRSNSQCQDNEINYVLWKLLHHRIDKKPQQ